MVNVGQTDRDNTADTRDGRAVQPRLIADKLFVDQLNYVREAIDFLIRRQIDLSKHLDDLNALVALGTVRYSRSGAPASEQDWQRLYQISNIFVSQLANEKATSFAVWQTRRFYSVLPLAFSVGAVTALAISCLNPNVMSASVRAAIAPPSASGSSLDTPLDYWDRLQQMFSVLLWTCSLGGLGVIAFFGTSLLNQMSYDSAMDAAKWKEHITDKNYLRARLSLGILFAFVIGLPFGFRSLSTACSSLIQPMPFDKNLFIVMLQILAPFLVGFSTSLVLAILERIIDAIRTMLGVQPNRSSS